MKYDAPWWLPGGNLQTLWAALRSERYIGAAPVFRRERWLTPDGDFVDVDMNVAPTLEMWPPRSPTSCGSLPPEGAARLRPGKAGSAPGAWLEGAIANGAPELLPLPPGEGWGEGSPSGAGRERSAPPLLIIFHGLEGSSASHYAEAFAAVAQTRGWACAVPHFRGCSGELNLAPRAYHSGDFEEIDWMLRRFAALHAGPLLAVGISLGGNALMRWAAEAGESAHQIVAAVASVCSPLDLAASGEAIGRGFNRQVYTRMFLQSMKPKALQKLAQHPGLFDRSTLLAARTLYEFDNVFTAPLHGFKNTDDYWLRASAKPHLRRIAIPALALNARNDPFVPASSLPGPRDVSAQVTLWQPAAGGHVGFPSAPLPGYPGHVRAMPEAVLAYLAAQI